ncbi:hypothetical protein HELRODRAFT_165935 [Helobdella robusta]|uniref:Cytochrome b-245 light chain n=1 Tax=Helobdella robusta TaxID=6412 RepID=T1EXH1_HELRO|nr:hypothetical protein HELRODRAFT_165935 [Helobdella robusta]ESN90289.1 hypothetical protein HELRODRAFT_165935 [Helobdella robusta]
MATASTSSTSASSTSVASLTENHANKSRSNFSVWANELALIGSCILLLGALIGVAGQFRNWQCAAVSIPISIVFIFIEYPRCRGEMRRNAREQDMKIYEKRKGHEQLDEQQS